MRSRSYGPDLTPPWKRSAPVPQVPAERDLVVEEAETGFCGAVLACEKSAGGVTVTLEDRFGRQRVFPLRPRGFLLEGAVVTLVRPAAPAPGGGPRLTASGSIAVDGARPRVAGPGGSTWRAGTTRNSSNASGATTCASRASSWSTWPAWTACPRWWRRSGRVPGARLGVLVDHLVPGSKESRVAEAVTGEHVLVVGHPFVDVWAAVKPARLAIPAWPDVPHGQDWKTGVCRALGWPDDTGAAWRRVLSAVRSYRDLDPRLLGRVEELIDFVTAPE